MMSVQVIAQAAKAAGQAAPLLKKVNPKILIAAGAAAIAGVGAGAKGAVDSVRGRSIRKAAAERFNDALQECESVRLRTEDVARQYGDSQVQVHHDTVGRFANWLEENEHLVKRLKFKRIDGVRISVPNIPRYVSDVRNVTAGLSGLTSAVGAGLSAQAGALWGVTTFASASTGTAISALSGAAAQSATLSWLGGGTLASGGGGMAAGSAVLGLVSVVPVLLVGGMTMGIVGAKTKTKATEFAAQVDVEVARIGLAQDLLTSTDQRIAELRVVLEQLSRRAVHAITELETLDFDPHQHAREFLRALQLVTAAKEVLNTPVLDPNSGELTDESVEVLRRYA